MNVVIQEEKTGCGLASVANIVGKSYSEIKLLSNSMGIFAEDEHLYSDTHYVRTLLDTFGVKYSKNEITFESWDSLPDLALLSIKYHEINNVPFWHWVVFKREGNQSWVLDSASYLASNIRTDFENMQPKWFIEIIKT